MTIPLASRDLALYNGISKRSRGWKSRKLGESMDGRLPHYSNIRRWDGAARMCYDWDNLRRDPELCFRNGNCFIHLYGKGQSRRGPAFKVPFSALLDCKCRPLIERFTVRYIPESPETGDGSSLGIDAWSRANLLGRVDLYIPPPPGSDKDQALQYHLATRNFFAWVFGRSMVGNHLGSALVSLVSSMYEFRSPDADHMADLVSYLDEEGYLDLRGQPNHALAILHLAEVFQMKDLYIDAFAHCTGMSDRLFLSSEYQHISSVSRKLIRRARVDMDVRLGKAGLLLRTFLEDDLSETHLGLSSGARAHLDRFRSFLLSFYTTKLGYYPPSSIDTRITIFEPKVYRTLAADFEALYEYLVDRSFTSAENSPILAQGGICTLQSVESFDLRHKYRSLANPLPLLPEITTSAASRRMSWLGKPDKLRPDNRLIAHAALMKATNKSRVDLFNNDLVCAYRKFEEDSIFSPLKADRVEKISQVDARKVRWILVYSVYQTLRSCTQAPPEVSDTKNVPYNLAVSTENLPPWKEEVEAPPQLLRSQTDIVMRSSSTSTTGNSSSASTTPSIEIKPDIDYFALTHRPDSRPSSSSGRRSVLNGPPIIPPRSMSLTRSLTRSGTIRRSLSLFKSSQTSEAPPPPPPPAPAVRTRQQSSYYEIVVHGYGNGTNAVNLSIEDEDVDKLLPPTSMANRSLSTSSNSSTGTSASGGEMALDSSSPPATPESPVTDYDPSPADSIVEKEQETTAAPPRGRQRTRQPVKYDTLPSRRTSPALTGGGVYAADDMSLPSRAPAIPVRNSARNCFSVYGEQQLTSGSGSSSMQPSPLRIRKRVTVQEILDCARAGEGPWHEIPETMQEEEEAADDIKPEWEQFADLGGHTVLPMAHAIVA